MLKAQKLLLTLGSVLFAALTLMLILENWPTAVTVRFLSQGYPPLSLGSIVALGALLATVSVSLGLGTQLLQLGTRHKKTGRELERKEVSREEAESRVKVLESKIETLEKALGEALKSSQPRP